MALPSPLQAVYEEALRFAALSGPFAPERALRAAKALQLEDAVSIASALALVCDTDPLRRGTAGTAAQWLLRTNERRYALATLSARKELDAEVAARRRLRPLDPEARDLLDALQGAGDFTVAAVEERVRKGKPRRALERVIVALDRAGEIAPAYPHLSSARAALGRLEREERWETLNKRPFVGRDDELKRIDAWLAEPSSAPPAKTLFIGGPAGVGKSSLLEQAARAAFERRNAIIIRLDFERGGLDARDLLGLTMELVRQVADRLGDRGKALLDARLEAASVTALPFSPEDSARMLFPRRLARRVAETVRGSKRPICFVLDTVEQLRARGETHAGLLFDWLDQLAGEGMGEYWVIAAGRGDAFDRAKDRVLGHIELGSLDEAATEALLVKLEVPPALRAAVRAAGGGIPLALRLAADAATGGSETGEAHGAAAIERAVARGLIYRTLLARIEDPAVQRLAPALVLPRLDPAILEEVVLPTLAANSATGDQTGAAEERRTPVAGAATAHEDADRLYRRLARLSWLVERAPEAGDFVRLRPDLRAALLPRLYLDRADECRRINLAAAEWYGTKTDSWSAAQALYHRLQAMRGGGPPVAVEPGPALALDDDLLAELPDEARSRVQAARGDRSEEARGAAAPAGPGSDAIVAAELISVAVRRDWTEGRHLTAWIRGRIDAGRSVELDDAVVTFLWRSGQWSEAYKLASATGGVLPSRIRSEDAPRAVALARFEMAAEFHPGPLLWMLGSDRASVPKRFDGAPTSDGVGSQGALGLLTWEPPVEGPTATPRVSMPGAAFETWAGQTAPGFARIAAEAGLTRIVRRTGSAQVMPDGEATRALCYAALSPYAAIVAAQATEPGKGWIIEEALEADRRLAAFPAPIGDRPDDPLGGITDLGLLSEWLAPLALRRADADLLLVAGAAERWRRTMAGAWAYPARPSKWAGRSRDVVAEARLAPAPKEPDEARDERWTALYTEPGGDPAEALKAYRASLAEPPGGWGSFAVRAGVVAAGIAPLIGGMRGLWNRVTGITAWR